MKKQNAEDLSHKIYLKINPRIVELVNKFIKGDYNEATMYAFQVGMESDIDNIINKSK